MLPPCSAGTIELRDSRAGATPRQPRNGCSGIRVWNFESSAENVASFLARSIA